MDQYLNRIFLADDPHQKLRAEMAPPPAAKGKKTAKGSKSAAAAQAEAEGKVVKLIEQAQVEPGMTRDEVLMSLGYPPAHRTPSLDSPTWTYWANRWATFEVYFDGDRVSRVNR